MFVGFVVVFNFLTGRGEVLVHDVGTREENGKQTTVTFPISLPTPIPETGCRQV